MLAGKQRVVKVVLIRYYIAMDEKGIYDYLERLDNLLRAETWKAAAMHQLQPIQLQMLDYLNRCNRYSNTPAGVTAYFQLTKGTVSQSLKALEKRGLITRQPDLEDGRKVHMLVTDAGQELLDKIFPLPFLQPVENDEETNAEIVPALKNLLSTLQHQNNLESFGVCHTCRHFQTEATNQYRCGLTHEILTSSEIDLICREHTRTT